MAVKGAEVQLDLAGAVLAAAYRDGGRLDALRARFLADGYVLLPDLLAPAAFARIRDHVAQLRPIARRCDFVMPEYGTPRVMATLGGRRIREVSPLLLSLYDHADVRALMEALAGRPVFTCTHPEEFMVLNFLEGAGQSHGWHLDDPDIALVIVVEAPPKGTGGNIELVADRVLQAPDGETTKALVDAAGTRGRIAIEYLPAGSGYLLHAAQILHRVGPLTQSASRAALNLAYGFNEHQRFGDTANTLYGS